MAQRQKDVLVLQYNSVCLVTHMCVCWSSQVLITSGKLALDVMEKLLRENGGGRQGGCKLDHRSDKSPLVLLQHRARRGLIRVGLEGEHKDTTCTLYWWHH